MRIDRKAAHDLQGGRRVFLADRHRARERGTDHPLAQHIAHVEKVVANVLGSGQRTRRLVIRRRGRHRNQLALWITQRGKATSECAARVDVDRVVEPSRLRDRDVPVDDERPASVVLSPVKAHGQPELVGLARCLAVQSEIADTARGAALHLLFETRVRDDEPAIVEHVVTDQAVQELGRRRLEDRIPLQLLEGTLEPVADLHVPAAQGTRQLLVVIAGHAQRDPVLHHRHDEAKHGRRVRPAVDEVSHEYDLAALWMHHVERAVSIEREHIAKRGEQFAELLVAAMHVTYDVERPVIALAVDPERLANDIGCIDRLDRVE